MYKSMYISTSLQSWVPKSDLRPQLVSGHENLQSDGFKVEVDGKYFFIKQLSKISTPFFHEKCRFTWNSKWFYKWMDHALFQQKNDHTIFVSTGYTCQTTCRQTVMCAGPADTLRTHFYVGISLGISLGITSDFTSEWITIFCNRKMITRYFYLPIMLARQPTSELWCVRALCTCITYGLISALQITWNFTWNFTWNSKWIYKWRNNAFLEQEKWSHGISID